MKLIISPKRRGFKNLSPTRGEVGRGVYLYIKKF